MQPETLLLLSFILLLLITCILPALSAATNYYRYTECAPTNHTCGKLNFIVGYPFQIGTARPDYCRYPGYYLTCTGDTLLINIDDGMKPFQVKNIDYGNYLLTLVDPNFIATACPLPNYNLTFNTTIFDSNDRDTNMTIYNCSTPQTFLPAGIYSVPCAEEMSGQYHYYYRLNNDSAFGNCISMSQVLVLAAAANQVYDENLNFEDMLNEGFMLKWTTGNGWCSECVNSGGYCGYNTVSRDDQTCYCPTRTAIRNCSTGNLSSKMSRSKGDGATTNFWSARWTGDKMLRNVFPNLFAATTHRHSSVQGWMQRFGSRTNLGFGNLLEQGVVDLTDIEQLHRVIQSIAFNPGADDVVWRWDTKGCFSVRSAYNFLMFDGVDDQKIRHLWSIKAPLSIKIFIWLAAQNRLKTADRLIKQGWHGPSVCVCCFGDEENLEHLLFSCRFARSVWSLILQGNQHLVAIVLHETGDLVTRWKRIRLITARSKQEHIDVCVAATCWGLWMERNHRLFDDQANCARECGKNILNTITTWRKVLGGHRDTHLL